MNFIELDRALRQLRLGGMAAVLETRLRQAQAEAMAPIDLISCLVSDELTRRTDRLLERRRKQARFRDPDRTLDNFDFTFNPKMNRSLVFDLATGTFISKRAKQVNARDASPRDRKLRADVEFIRVRPVERWRDGRIRSAEAQSQTTLFAGLKRAVGIGGDPLICAPAKTVRISEVEIPPREWHVQAKVRASKNEAMRMGNLPRGAGAWRKTVPNDQIRLRGEYSR